MVLKNDFIKKIKYNKNKKGNKNYAIYLYLFEEC